MVTTANKSTVLVSIPIGLILGFPVGSLFADTVSHVATHETKSFRISHLHHVACIEVA